jgi:membrane protein implicated in regulation of membrane protease activity
MKKRGWSYRIVLRYLLFQLPGLVALSLILILLRLWLNIPLWSVWTVVVIWVAKDVIMFPFVWRSYDKSVAEVHEGAKGTAMERLSPSGYVMVRGELWRAEILNGNPPITKGETILICGSRGLTLLVKKDRDNDHE